MRNTQQPTEMVVTKDVHFAVPRCLKLVLEKQPSVQLNCKLVTRTIPEAVTTFHVEAVKKENVAVDLLENLGQRFDVSEIAGHSA